MVVLAGLICIADNFNGYEAKKNHVSVKNVPQPMIVNYN